jgi:hypothetical protein
MIKFTIKGMLSIILGNIHYVIIGIITFFSIYVFRRNVKLNVEKEELKQNNLEKEKIIDIQQKVLNASEKVKHTDLDTNLERLSVKRKKNN